ncbi:hypothetical protein PMI40_01945, partial [Herbaspirillum sp. YR522]
MSQAHLAAKFRQWPWQRQRP